MTDPATRPADEWWRSAVVYQVYSAVLRRRQRRRDRRHRRASGPGCRTWPTSASTRSGSAPGTRPRWLDGGYDVADYRDIDPEFGTLADADALITEAHALGLRVLIDLVPNHSSDQHPWFQAALGGRPGSRRARPLLLPRRPRPSGELPPNNWPAAFGGPAWTRISEPDGTRAVVPAPVRRRSSRTSNWDNPEVSEEFDRSCGSGSTAASTASGSTWPTRWRRTGRCPTWRSCTTGSRPASSTSATRSTTSRASTTIHQRWRAIADEYADTPQGRGCSWPRRGCRRPSGSRATCGRDELHSAFNFDVLSVAWDATASARGDRPTPRDAPAGRRGAGDLGAEQPRHDPARTRYGRRPAGRVGGRGRRARPISSSAAAAPGPPRSSSSPFRAAPTSTRATSSACPRSRTCPKTSSTTPPGSGPATRSAAATAAASRSRGQARSRRTASVPASASPGSPSRPTGPP